MAGLFARMTALFAETKSDEPSGGPPAEAVALAALMVQLARSDGTYDAEERTGVVAAMEARFGDGETIVAAGEAAEQGALDSHQFTRLVKEAYAPEERIDLIEDLWSVVLADGARHAHEDALMRQIGSLLHVPDRDVGIARQRALAKIA